MAKQHSNCLDTDVTSMSGQDEILVPDIATHSIKKVCTGYDVQYKDGKVVKSTPIYQEV